MIKKYRTIHLISMNSCFLWVLPTVAVELKAVHSVAKIGADDAAPAVGRLVDLEGHCALARGAERICCTETNLKPCHETLLADNTLTVHVINCTHDGA